MRRFTRGEHIAHRSVDRDTGAVMTVLAQIVVRDEPAVIVTYMPAGSTTKRRTGERGGGPQGRQLLRWDGGHEDRPWTGTNVLQVHRPGDGWSLWSAWDATDDHHAWWYVNLEEPWRRTQIGFDSRDLWLDLWRKPGNAARWNWKDEDELEWAVTEGRCSTARAAAIRADGQRAIEAIDRGAPPFDEDWSSWRPDPAWGTPILPVTWRTELLAL